MTAAFPMDFSLLSPLEIFVDPKNVDGRNNKPPAIDGWTFFSFTSK